MSSTWVAFMSNTHPSSAPANLHPIIIAMRFLIWKGDFATNPIHFHVASKLYQSVVVSLQNPPPPG